MRSDREERGERGKKKKKSRSGSRTHCRSVLNQLSGSLAVPCDGTGPLWWTARCSSASWRPAVAPPVEGLSDSVSLLPPGFRHQCNEDSRYGKKEAGTGEHLKDFNNKINKHKVKAAAPHGRLPRTKHKLKSRPGRLSSSTVVTPPFIPSGAPPWDSRPVSGAGVVHYHLLHRPRSISTALCPAPLVTVSKTKKLIVDFRKRQQRPYTPMISGTPVERVSSFKYLGVNISEDLTWTAHIQTQVKKARQRLYHLRQLRKFRVSPAILKTFYSGAIESVLTQCISVWYNNATNQDCKALQRVVRLAERISGSTLPSLQGIYLKRCRSRAAKITKDSNHPGNHLFRLLPSGRRYRSLMAKTERLRKSFFPQAIRLLNTNSVP